MSNILLMEIPMSSIPYPLEPLARCNPYFEVVVKPGILKSSLTYAIFPILNTDGYCKVVDWGDGLSSEAAKAELLHIPIVRQEHILFA